MPRLSKYNARQRKKLHLGEFQEFGFGVTTVCQKDLTEQQLAVLLDDFLTNAIESNQLVFGGGFEAEAGDLRLEGYIMLDARQGSVSEEQRAAVEAWLKARSELTEVSVEALSDAWYA
ncbi:YggL family protein [Leeia sp. TBRC 13508]|uniref:YggL family protein n=1 Tax=Leeia speluncae TaxID=2884804 RepID=A0ABS8D2U5_9NEIS|nr:YggL family protein [Leeia speluncae]MCB6181968.1 YggL family protein [Leeia speluncae]